MPESCTTSEPPAGTRAEVDQHGLPPRAEELRQAFAASLTRLRV
jgi:hypothetical protein